MVGSVLILILVVGLVILYLAKWGHDHGSVSEIFDHLKTILPLKETTIKKYPLPTIVGTYFGYRISMDGSSKKRKGDHQPGYRFLATIELPKHLSMRLFLLHEQRKTSLKSIAGLSLVPTGIEKFDNAFLLLSSDKPKAAAVFQNYLLIVYPKKL